MDHKAEFELMVMKRYGKEASDGIDWGNPRLLCIADGFTKYDEHAIQQINRNIELYQYKHYKEGFLLLDLVNATTQNEQINEKVPLGSITNITKSKTVVFCKRKVHKIAMKIYTSLPAGFSLVVS